MVHFTILIVAIVSSCSKNSEMSMEFHLLRFSAEVQILLCQQVAFPIASTN